MEKSKVDIVVRNQKYTVVSDENPQTVLALANELNLKLDDIMANGRVSITQALILACLDFGNTALQQHKEAERLKGDMAAYLEDAEKAMTERDKYKRENERLKEKFMAKQKQ